MKRLIFLLIVVAAGFSTARACRCMALPDTIKDQKDLKEYSFIAHIKFGAMQELKDSSLGSAASWSLKIIELFKGSDTVTQVFERLRFTSCNMHILEGEEWLIFAQLKDGKLNINRCSRSSKYKTAGGSLELQWGNNAYTLRRLRELYKPSPAAAKNTKAQERSLAVLLIFSILYDERNSFLI
jgi:hypothetical protein